MENSRALAEKIRRLKAMASLRLRLDQLGPVNLDRLALDCARPSLDAKQSCTYGHRYAKNHVLKAGLNMNRHSATPWFVTGMVVSWSIYLRSIQMVVAPPVPLFCRASAASSGFCNPYRPISRSREAGRAAQAGPHGAGPDVDRRIRLPAGYFCQPRVQLWFPEHRNGAAKNRRAHGQYRHGSHL